MNFPLFIAKRYFRSKKKKNFISIISNISMLGVAVGTMALVVALSVFNGLEEMIRALYGSFDPDLKVEAVRGKTFEAKTEFLKQINELEGIAYVTEVIEDNALVRYKDAQKVVKLKGVSDNFHREDRMEKAIVRGEFKLKDEGKNLAVLGIGVKYALEVSLPNDFYLLQVYYPKAGTSSSFNPENLTNRRMIRPVGVFSIQQEYDNYMFVPLQFARDLMEYGNELTALEIQVEKGYEVEEVQDRLKEITGDEFHVRNSDEQHASLFRAVKIEKLFVYLVFCFILAIASFNIFFSLSMLAIDKKKDVAVLYALGASDRIIRNIFLAEGAIIAFIGSGVGLILGLIVCWLQQNFGLISMGMQTSVIEAYPIRMQWTDFLYTGLSVLVITLLASYRPAVMATRTEVNMNL